MAAFERSTSIDLRALAGLPPDKLAAAIDGNVDDVVRKFWRALAREGALKSDVRRVKSECFREFSDRL